MSRLVRPGALLALWLASVGASGVVTIPPDRDNTLFEDASGSLSNGAGPVLFAGNNGQGLAHRALLRFDIAGSLPLGAMVGGVELTVSVSNAPNTTPRTFTVHRVLRDWGEGTSTSTGGSGAPAAVGDATWLHTFYPGQFWEEPGGDLASIASASQTISGVGFYTWANPGLTSDVQAWLDDPTGNFGWLIRGDEVTLNTARRFDSRENEVAANCPSLRISYTNTVEVPGETVRGDIWLAQHHPNPVVGAVRISFELPTRASVHLEVLDLAGRRVATLVEGVLEPGRHEAEWSARNERGGKVPVGVYFYRLVVDGRNIASRRVVMVR
jgi:FlgD Ig-like domain